MSTDWRDYLRPITYIDWVKRSMETERGRQTVFATGGILGAVIVLVGGYILYGQIVGIPAPDVQNAPIEKVTQFLGSPQGYARLSVPSRQDFLVKVMQTYEEPAKREQLAQALSKMTTEEKVTLREATWDVGYKIFTEEVEQYYKAPPESRHKFVDRKLYEYHQARARIVGDPQTKAREQKLVDHSWTHGMPTDSDGVVKMLITRTRPEDRARMKPYVDALRTRMEELKKNPAEAERLMAKFQAQDRAAGK